MEAKSDRFVRLMALALLTVLVTSLIIICLGVTAWVLRTLFT
jgi:hypothetical protein